MDDVVDVVVVVVDVVVDVVLSSPLKVDANGVEVVVVVVVC